MANSFDEVRSIRGRASGDQYSDAIDDARDSFGENFENTHPLETDEALRTHKRLLEWYYLEKSRQAENRLEMAMDADFYDGIQWDPADAAELERRGQMPLVYNETAPMVDWLIGTERRTRVDWKVLPRAEDDVSIADIKTKVMKYVSDVNRVPFARSRAFADAVKVGVGWVDDGVRDDPTQDILYSKYEDWRNVIWDTSSYELDLTDARYVFRWRWVDEDIAIAMFPDREQQIKSAMEDQGQMQGETEEDNWYTSSMLDQNRGTLYATGGAMMVDAQRRRVKLIEGQFRMPVSVQIVEDGPMRGNILGPNDHTLRRHVAQAGISVTEKVMMRVHFAVFTERDLIAMGPSIYRHNRFSLTPIWCYRRGRDRMPYGAIRRIRDIQQDLNKRASKALFMLNTNQIIADDDAVKDWEVLRDEADRPDGLIVKKQGKELTIRRDTDAATGQIQMMSLDAQNIQKIVGITDENMGRHSNAVAGVAIQARQNQGSIVTTEPFDNLRFAIQVQGEKQLSLTEQFYSQDKVIRLTGSGPRSALEWVKVNQLEQQADGSVRVLNDITASMGDFVVSDQDYAGTLRQVMFDSLNNLAQRLPPEVALRLLTMAMDFSDLPNKDEIADAIRKITGERDPNKEITPEEKQKLEEQQQQQAEAMQLQREAAITALQEQKAKVAKLQAEAAEIMAHAQAPQGEPQPDIQGEIQQAVLQVQRQAAEQIDSLTEQLRKVQTELTNRTVQINRDADVKLETARINQEGQERVAQIQAVSDRTIASLEQRIQALSQQLTQSIKEVEAKATEREVAAKATPEPVSTGGKPEASGKKIVKVMRDEAGKIVGAEVTQEQ